MGQAKRKGTFEQRQAAAVSKRQAEEREDFWTEMYIVGQRITKPIVLLQSPLGECDIGIRFRYVEPPSRHELKLLHVLSMGLSMGGDI